MLNYYRKQMGQKKRRNLISNEADCSRVCAIADKLYYHKKTTHPKL